MVLFEAVLAVGSKPGGKYREAPAKIRSLLVFQSRDTLLTGRAAPVMDRHHRDTPGVLVAMVVEELA